MTHRRLLSACRRQNRFVPVSAERVDQCGCAAVLGNLSQYSFRSDGTSDYHSVLSECKKDRRQKLSVYVAHDSAEFRFLHPCRIVDRREPADRNADDTENLRLRMDDSDRIP